jgi:hypothetical protein
MNYFVGAILTTFILFHSGFIWIFCNMINEDQNGLEMVRLVVYRIAHAIICINNIQ